MYEQLYKRAKENDCDVVKSAFYTYYDVVGQRPRDKKCNWHPQEKRRKKHICWEMPSGIFTIYEHPEFFYFHPSVWSCIYRRDFIVQHKIRMEELPGASWTDNLFQVQTLSLAKSIAYIDKAFYHWRLQHNDDAKDLKDLTIPFLRTRTIHTWLRENSIADENLWACLYKREFAYMPLVLRAVKFRQLRGLRPMFREMLQDMTPEIVRGNKYITSQEQSHYRNLRRPLLMLLQIICKKIAKMKSIFSFKIPCDTRFLMGSQFRIVVLGFQVAASNDDACSPESVGEFWFWQFSKCVIERDFQRSFRPKYETVLIAIPRISTQ